MQFAARERKSGARPKLPDSGARADLSTFIELAAQSSVFFQQVASKQGRNRPVVASIKDSVNLTWPQRVITLRLKIYFEIYDTWFFLSWTCL